MMVLPDNVHDPLFSPAALRLGEIHWYVLKAANVMDARRFRKTQHHGGFATAARTDFGKEVGRDEIHWWVSKKEASIEELRTRTECALDAAQILKEASTALKNNRPDSYDDLLSALRRFAEDHHREIEALYEYVRWLSMRDIVAPSILYTYRVWGSTRMSDRWVQIDAETLQADKPETTRNLAEIVLGLRSGGLYAFDRAYMEIGEEIWSSMDPEDAAASGRAEVPIAWVVARAAREVCDECATYFVCIRDSLRNVLIDTDKLVEQRNLMHSDAFWRAFIDKAVRTRKTETQLWDFKETLTMWHVKGGAERERAKVTFSEDVASFANARGGVLVIGVTNGREIVGICNDPCELENRLKFASQVIPAHLEYDREIASFRQVIVTDAARVDRICLVVVVAQGCEPVGVDHGGGHYTYPVRRETGIERESRSSLASAKMHMKSDNHDFLCELDQFIHDN